MPLFTRRHALALAAASVCSLALPARAAPLDGVFYPDLAGKSQGLTGAWRGEGVFNIEQFDPDPFMDMLNKHGLPWQVKELDAPLDF